MKWHQDFPFEPITNDDMIFFFLFIEYVTLENGPLGGSPATTAFASFGVVLLQGIKAHSIETAEIAERWPLMKAQGVLGGAYTVLVEGRWVPATIRLKPMNTWNTTE